MNRKRRWYTAAWAVMFVLFQVLAFIVPRAIGGGNSFDGAFWTGYVFLTLAFVGQYGCAWAALRDEASPKQFYHIPLITVSYGGLILTVACAGLVMGVPGFPVWAGLVLCLCVFAFTAVSLVKAEVTANVVGRMDEEVRAKTLRVRELTAEAETLLAKADSEEKRAACKKVYEALRYSDPTSSPALSGMEAEIGEKLAAFSGLAAGEAGGEFRAAADALVALIHERNLSCRRQK